MSSSSTLPPAPTPPPSQALASLYGDSGSLVLAPRPVQTITPPAPEAVHHVEALDAESPALQHFNTAIQGGVNFGKSILFPEGNTEKERLKNIAKNTIEKPEQEQTIKAGQALNRADEESRTGHPVRAALSRVEAGGHALAGAVPLVGPWAASVAEPVGTELGKGEYGAATGDVAGNLFMLKAGEEISEGAKKGSEAVVKGAGETAKSAISAAGPEVKAAVSAKAPEGSTEAGKVNFKDVGGKELRAPDSFGRTPGKFNDAVDAGYDAARKAETAKTDRVEPEIKAEGPTWDRVHSAMVDGKKVGSVGYKVDSDGRAQIYGSNVIESMRSKGIGQATYRSVIDEAHANPDVSRITSDSTNTTPAANRVWEKLKAKGLPVEEITHPNGKPGYQIDFDKPALDLSPAYGDTGKRVGSAPDSLLMNERQSALKEPYDIEVKNPDGSSRVETIGAFSSKDALKIAQKKFPGANEWSNIKYGTRTPSTEYSVPAQKILSMPEAEGRTPEQTISHELGHALVGQNEGLDQEGILRHTHPDLAGGNSRAAVRWPASAILQGGRVIPTKLPAVIKTFMGGIAADEVFNDIPRAANHNFDIRRGGDGGKSYDFLKQAGYSHEDALDFMHKAIDSAKEYLTKPDVSDIVKENAGVREPNLSKQYHFSGERLRQMHTEAQRRMGNEVPDNGTNDGSGDSNREANVTSGKGEATPAVGQVSPAEVHTHEVNPKEDTSFEFGANEKSANADTSGKSANADIQPWATKAVEMAKNQGGGFTVDPRTGEAPKGGYQIEVGTEQRPAPLDHIATPKDIQDFYDKNKALFDQHPELHVGGYNNELNLSAHVDSLDAAKRVAKKLDQKSIWDNAKGEEIPTGGKGERTDFSNFPLTERMNELRGNAASTIPGFEHLSKDFHDNMEPDEREYLKGNKTLQRNAMSQYHKIIPSVAETTNAMQAGAALGGWWQRFIDVFHGLGSGGTEEFLNTVGPSHAEVLKQWHSAVSGNKSVQDAANLAMHSYADWLEAGQPTDRTSIDNIIKKNAAQPEGSGKKGNAAISDTLNKKGKILSAGLDTSKLYGLVNSPEMRGERPFGGEAFNETNPNPLVAKTEGARKIPSMGASTAGKGNLNRLVIDAHIRDFYGHTNSGGPAAQYIADSVHLRQAAKDLGLKGGEGQEQLWGTVLGLKSLLKEGLTSSDASGKLNSDVINKIGKDYAEVLENDPEISKPGGVLDRFKDQFGIGRGASGASETYRQTSGSRAGKGGPASSETPIDQALLSKTAERIRGQISESKIKKPTATTVEPAPRKVSTPEPVEDKYTAALKAGDAAAKAKRDASMRKGISDLAKSK